MSDRDSGLLDPANIRSRLLAAAAGSTPVAVFAVDLHGTVLFAEGDGIRRLSGKTTEVEGLSVVEAWGETPMLVSAIGQALGGVRFAGNLTVGEHRFSIRVLPLVDGEHGIRGAAGLAVESTPAVFDANGSGVAQVLEALVESMPLSVWVLDHRGDVVRENVFAKELGLGAVRSARETSPGAPSLVGQVLLEGRESRGTARFRDATGDLTDVPIRGIPLRNANGSTIGALLMAPPPLTLPAGPPSVDFVFSDALRLSSASWDPIPGDVLSATWN